MRNACQFSVGVFSTWSTTSWRRGLCAVEVQAEPMQRFGDRLRRRRWGRRPRPERCLQRARRGMLTPWARAWASKVGDGDIKRDLVSAFEAGEVDYLTRAVAAHLHGAVQQIGEAVHGEGGGFDVDGLGLHVDPLRECALGAHVRRGAAVGVTLTRAGPSGRSIFISPGLSGASSSMGTAAAVHSFSFGPPLPTTSADHGMFLGVEVGFELEAVLQQTTGASRGRRLWTRLRAFWPRCRSARSPSSRGR